LQPDDQGDILSLRRSWVAHQAWSRSRDGGALWIPATIQLIWDGIHVVRDPRITVARLSNHVNEFCVPSRWVAPLPHPGKFVWQRIYSAQSTASLAARDKSGGSRTDETYPATNERRSQRFGELQPGEALLERTTMAGMAYALIKRDIVRCDLSPGQRVTEVEMVDRYDIGRGAVRVALTRLEQEGFVHVRPRQGYHVAPLSLKQVDDLFVARKVLETAAARMAAGHVDGASLARLDALCLDYYSQGTQEGVESYLKSNTAFHLTIARASDNDILVEMISGLFDKMERLLHITHLLHNHERPAFVDEHAEIIHALVAGDSERAAVAIEKHVSIDTVPIYNALMNCRSLRSSYLTIS
jgi:DNA-binding GntR family transcriptional regulator